MHHAFSWAQWDGYASFMPARTYRYSDWLKTRYYWVLSEWKYRQVLEFY